MAIAKDFRDPMTIVRLFGHILAPAERLVATLTDPARRERAVILVLLAYVAIWTFYGVLAKASQDVHSDMAELVVWSRELALGYPKHPPLAAWLTAAWFALFPVSDWAFYLLAMTMPGLALWLAWRLAEDYLDDRKRVLALALLTFVPFFNFHALKFNVNTVLLPLWVATALCFLRSFERRSIPWAALAGLCAGAAMLGKYWSIFLVMGLGLAALVDPRRTVYFRSAAPWVTIAVGLLVLAPHVAWLAAHDFAPFSYATASHLGTAASAARSVVSYFAGAVSYVAAPVLLALVIIRPDRSALADMLWPASDARRLVAIAFWAPLLLPVLAAPLTGVEITSLWSMSAWTLLPVVLLSSPRVVPDRRASMTVAMIAIAFPLLMVAAATAIAHVIHRAGPMPPAAVHSKLLAERVASEWRQQTDRPLRMVGGDYDLAYGVAFYLPSRPSAFPDFNRGRAPWVDLASVQREGIAVVCRVANPRCLQRAAAQGLAGPRIDVEIARSYFGVAGRHERYAIMIVPPSP